MTKFYISFEEREARYGILKENCKTKKAVIITLKTETEDLGWGQTCLLNYMISHDPEFRDLLKALNSVDLINIQRLQNPETPFLCKVITYISDLVKCDFPIAFLPSLKKSVIELKQTIELLEPMARSKIQDFL